MYVKYYTYSILPSSLHTVINNVCDVSWEVLAFHQVHLTYLHILMVFMVQRSWKRKKEGKKLLQADVYKGVINDVIGQVKEAFLDENVDIDVLQQLKKVHHHCMFIIRNIELSLFGFFI